MNKERLQLTITVGFYELCAIRGACLQAAKRSQRMVDMARDPDLNIRRVQRLTAAVAAADAALAPYERKE